MMVFTLDINIWRQRSKKNENTDVKCEQGSTSLCQCQTLSCSVWTHCRGGVYLWIFARMYLSVSVCVSVCYVCAQANVTACVKCRGVCAGIVSWGEVRKVGGGGRDMLQVSSRCTQILMHYYYLNRVKKKKILAAMTTRSINILLYHIQSRNSHPPPKKNSIKNIKNLVFPEVDVKFDLNHPSLHRKHWCPTEKFQKIKKVKKNPSPPLTLIFCQNHVPPPPSSCLWKIWTPTKNTDIFQKKKKKKLRPLYFSVNNWWPWQQEGVVTKEITKLTHTGMIITWSPVRALDWSIFNRSSSR